MKPHTLLNRSLFHHCKGKLHKYFINTPFWPCKIQIAPINLFIQKLFPNLFQLHPLQRRTLIVCLSERQKGLSFPCPVVEGSSRDTQSFPQGPVLLRAGLTGWQSPQQLRISSCRSGSFCRGDFSLPHNKFCWKS